MFYKKVFLLLYLVELSSKSDSYVTFSHLLISPCDFKFYLLIFDIVKVLMTVPQIEFEKTVFFRDHKISVQ